MSRQAGECTQDFWCTECYPGDVWSNVMIGQQRLTWRELAEQQAEEVNELRRWKRMILDLDRNSGGRHCGDVDAGVPAGISAGNPHLPPGTVLGYDLGGRRYVVPEPSDRHNLEAWHEHS